MNSGFRAGPWALSPGETFYRTRRGLASPVRASVSARVGGINNACFSTQRSDDPPNRIRMDFIRAGVVNRFRYSARPEKIAPQ